jgi:hypothetical protein
MSKQEIWGFWRPKLGTPFPFFSEPAVGAEAAEAVGAAGASPDLAGPED